MCLHVRAFTAVESRQVSAWLKKSQNGVQMRRAQILSFSAQGMKIQGIATQLLMNEEYLRELIRTFNNSGLEALKIRRSSGRPHILTEEEKSIVVEVATAPPQAYGRPFNQCDLFIGLYPRMPRLSAYRGGSLGLFFVSGGYGTFGLQGMEKGFMAQRPAYAMGLDQHDLGWVY